MSGSAATTILPPTPTRASLSQSVAVAWNLFSLITEDGSVWTVGGPGARPVLEARGLASGRLVMEVSEMSLPCTVQSVESLRWELPLC